MAVKLIFKLSLTRKAIYLFLPLNSFSILEQAVLEKQNSFSFASPRPFKSNYPFCFRSPETKNKLCSTIVPHFISLLSANYLFKLVHNKMLLLAYAHSINFLMKKSNDDTLHSCHLNSLISTI